MMLPVDFVDVLYQKVKEIPLVLVFIVMDVGVCLMLFLHLSAWPCAAFLWSGRVVDFVCWA